MKRIHSLHVERLFSPFLPRPVEIAGAPKTTSFLLQTLPGWQLSRDESSTRLKPWVSISRARKYFQWKSDFLPAPEKWSTKRPSTSFGLLCDLHFEWSDWFIRTTPDHFVLHAGAVDFGKGVVIFPSDQKAGKSVLTMQCAAHGHRVFSDDVIAIARNGDAVSLGLAPRLRLPLPDLGDPKFVAFTTASRGPNDHRYQYMLLNEQQFAPRLTRKPIVGIVMLERADGAETKLESVSHGTALQQVIRKNFAENMPVDTIFSRLKSLTGKARRYKLTYGNGLEAIEKLREVFG